MGGKLWLTYAWVDNKENADVDHVIRELRKVGLDVHFDRRQIIPGNRLWPQIDKAITDPKVSDAWAIYATKNSLSSEPCIEELAYALDRALRSRGGSFPIIGIFPEPIDRALIPSSIATRLYVTTSDPNWAGSVCDGVVGSRSEPQLAVTQPFVINTHAFEGDSVFEVRPRTGRWYPFRFGVPEPEFKYLKRALVGPKDVVPANGFAVIGEVTSEDGKVKGQELLHAVDPLNSAFIRFSTLPSELYFGQPPDLYHAERLLYYGWTAKANLERIR